MTTRNKAIVKAQALLDEFLSGYRKSDGGYATVTDEDETKLKELIRSILEAKFQHDPDGDLPVEVTVVNRHKYERNAFWLVPYSYKVDTMDELLDIVTIAHNNLFVANYILDREMKHLTLMRHDLKKKEQSK